jgi:hypothetical protein
MSYLGSISVYEKNKKSFFLFLNETLMESISLFLEVYHQALRESDDLTTK